MKSSSQSQGNRQESKMASKEEPEELTLSELIASAEMMHCSQCGDVFTEPMLLPCLHYFCLECLVDLLLHVREQQDKNDEPKNMEERLSPSIQASNSHTADPILDGGSSIRGEKVLDTDQGTSVRENTSCQAADTAGGKLTDKLTVKTKNIKEVTNVGDILREIEGRPPGPGERSSARPRRLRPLSAKPESPTKRTTTTPSIQEELPISSVSKGSVEIAASTGESTRRLLRQNKGSSLCLVCPICGHEFQLKAGVLLQDDDDDSVDGGADVNATNCPNNSEIKSIPAAMTTAKLRVLLRKTITASLLPNHFLKSLATIHRHKNPAGDNVLKVTKENSPEGTGARKEGIREESHLLCAYCLSEGQTVEACCLCLDCNDRMCEACASAHRKTRVTRNHTVAPLSSIRQGLFDHDLRAQDHVTCLSHQGVAVSCFCCDCLMAVCKRCKAGQHRTHKMTSLQDISLKLVSELSQIQRAIGRRVPGLASYLLFLKEQVNKLENKKQLVAQQITEQALLIHKMIDEHKQKLLSRLAEACTEQTSHISAKIHVTTRDKESLAKTSAFLLHLARLGRADEIVTSYNSIVNFYRLLINGSHSGNPEGQEDVPSVTKGQCIETRNSYSDSDNGAKTGVSPKGADARSPPSAATLNTRLACVFSAGPCTETNVGILFGPLDLHKMPLNKEDSPRLPLTTLMPERLRYPRVQSIFHTGIPSDQYPVYPSGLALHPRLLALVDRENAEVKILDKSNWSSLRSITGEGSSRLVKPFDVVFLDKTGTTLAVSDSEAGVVRVFECLTGKFLRDFAGDVRHPRGLVIMPDTGQVVVVDGHLRHLTFHDPATGQMVRRLRPTLKPNYSYSGSSSTDAEEDQRDYNLDNDNDNTNLNIRFKRVKDHHKSSTGSAETLSNPITTQANANFKSTALIDPYYIAITLSGDFAVTDQASPNLKIVSKDTGDILSQDMDYGTGQQESLHPSGLCVDHYGQIFISDTNNNRVHLALPNGQLTGTVLLQDKRKTALAKTALANEMKNELEDSSSRTEGKTEIAEEAGLNSDGCDISVSKPLCLAIDNDRGHLVVAQVGGQVKVVQYM